MHEIPRKEIPEHHGMKQGWLAMQDMNHFRNAPSTQMASFVPLAQGPRSWGKSGWRALNGTDVHVCLTL